MPRSDTISSENSSFNETKTLQNRSNAKGNKNLRHEDFNVEKYVQDFKQDELSLEKVHTPYFRIASKFRARSPQFLIHRPIIMQEDFGSR